MLNNTDYLKGLLFGIFGMLVLTYCTPVNAQTHKQEETTCLAKNMYWEARNQSMEGMIAVAYVTMNRVHDERFPNTVCQVVYQGQHSKWFLEKHNKWHPLRDRCQFSWYCDGKADVMYDEESLHIAKEIAHIVLDDFTTNGVIDITEGATHYHTTNVSPYWANSRGMAKVTTVGTHIFYKWN